MESRFDSEVLRALEKWPNVPACYDWLRLSRRGQWLIKDQPISHRGAIDFLNRNYACDAQGQWFIQNGPQRAYCVLDYTPWIYQLDGCDRIQTHTRREASELQVLVIDDEGNLLLQTDLGIGLLQDRDLARFIQVLDDQAGSSAAGGGVANFLTNITSGSITPAAIAWNGGCVPVRAMRAVDIPAEFGFVDTPAPITAGDTA